MAFRQIVPISARHGTQVDDLLQVMEDMLPEGPPFYAQDMLTDSAERFIVGEMIREKVFRLTGEEIPYGTAVTVEVFEETRGGKTLRIAATIHVERDSQKGMIIGRGGRKLKQIGQAARDDIENLLGTRVYLELFVRVQKNWTRDTRALRKFGY
jgi:GTP-binding protein Era